MNGTEIATGILYKYSSTERDETHCRMSDLVSAFAHVIDKLIQENEQLEEHHNAWLRMQGRFL